MLSAREKVAALRSKRLAQGGLRTKPVDPPAIATDQHDVHTPKTLTPQKAVDQVIKQSAGSTPSTPGGKLPTPTRRRFRNDPRAMRLLWRQYQLRHARKVAVQNAVNSDAYTFMTATVPDEEKTPVACKINPSAQPASDRRNEEENDLRNHCGGGDDEDEDDDDYKADENDADDEQDEEERALQSAQQQDFQHDEASTLDAHDVSASNDFVDKHNQHTRDEEDSNDNSRHGPSDDNPSPANSNDAVTKCGENDLSDPNFSESGPKPVERSSVPKINFAEDSTLEHSSSNPAEPSDVKNVDMAAGSISPLSSCPFVDQEAEEDVEANDSEPRHDKPRYLDEIDEDLCVDDDDDAIVADERPTKADAIAIASFHRQWELQQEQDQVAAVAAGTKRRLVDDFDEAVDLTGANAASKDPKLTETCKTDVADGETSEGGENADSGETKGNAKKDSTAEYLEAMYVSALTFFNLQNQISIRSTLN